MNYITKKEEVIGYPRRLLMYGAPKAGKTTAESMLPDSLIIDLEDGTSEVIGDIVNIPAILTKEDLPQLEAIRVIKDVFDGLKERNPYRFLVIDTVDMLEYYMGRYVADEFNVASYQDLEYGRGYSELRDRIINMLEGFVKLGLNVIVVGHRKKTLVDVENREVRVNDLDVTGKLKGFLFGWADAIGYCNRSSDESATYFNLSFKADEKENVESGTRIKALSDQNVSIIKMDKDGTAKQNWKAVYPFLAGGK